MLQMINPLEVSEMRWTKTQILRSIHNTDVRNWFSNIEQHASEGVNKILIGNKCDMEDKRVSIIFFPSNLVIASVSYTLFLSFSPCEGCFCRTGPNISKRTKYSIYGNKCQGKHWSRGSLFRLGEVSQDMYFSAGSAPY